MSGSRPPSGEWRIGWPVVAVGAVGMVIPSMHGSLVGAVMPSLETQFGWGRSQISAPLLIISTVLLCVGPVIGLLIDRFGPRRVALIAPVIYCGLLASVSFAGPGIVSWYVIWTLVALALPAVGPVLWTSAVSRTFDRHRGLALSTVLAGVGLANFIVPLAAAKLIPGVGWRLTFPIIAISALVVIWPAICVLYHPDRIAAQRAVQQDHPAEATGMLAEEIIRAWRFWALAASMMLIAMVVGGLTIHFQPFMRDSGMSALEAASYAAIIGPTTILGRLAGGFFLDRFTARYVAAAIFSFPVIVCAIFLNFDGSGAQALVASAILGLAYGAEADLLAYLAARYFGLRRYGFSFGLLVGIYSIGFGLAPVLAGAAFDALGSYDLVFQAMIVAVVACVAVVLTLGRPPDFGESENARPEPEGPAGAEPVALVGR